LVRAGEDDPQEIRAEIEHTRADLSETLDAIQDKLNPEHLKEQVRDQARATVEQAKETVREATISRTEEMISSVGNTARGAGFSLKETIQENPLPAALVGIGLGWLFLEGRSSNSPGRRTGRGRPADPGWVGHAEGQTPPSSSVGQRVQEARGKVQEVASQAPAKAAELTGQAQEEIHQFGSQVQDQADRTQGQFERLLRENPLAVGGLALALGAATGLVLPETRQEDELLGQARDNLIEQAQGIAQETQQKVQRVAEEAQTAGRSEAGQ
jgi:ElaB/YqjD/DUF883 family membrane-anchored ribosome-binding protein